ncbi:MAG: hypothetical protein ACYTDT_02410, partial [Planctomycetota bacterium]
MDKVYRILDANINRASEGLRTAEEYARLVLEDRSVQGLLKSSRAGLKAISVAIGLAGVGARDIYGDIGTDESAKGSRNDPADVARAALRRAQEALRVIEEYGQTIAADISSSAAKLRYSVYEIEQQLLVNAPRRKVVEQSAVMVICDSLGAREGWQSNVQSLLDVGARLFQLREKSASASVFLQHAGQLVELVGDSGVVV